MPTWRELSEWAPKLLNVLRNKPELTDVASDQQSGGLQVSVDVDREQASRLNVLTQAIDDTLYDAFGQRQVSTIFTQLNQYRVVLEVEPQYQFSPESLEQDLRQVQHRADGAAERLCQGQDRHRAADHRPPGPVPGRDALLQPAARAARWARRSKPSRPRRRKSACRIRWWRPSPAARRNSSPRSRASRS